MIYIWIYIKETQIKLVSVAGAIMSKIINVIYHKQKLTILT